MQIEDLEGSIEAMLFSTQYERLNPSLNEDKAVLIRGLVLPEENAPPKISVQEIVPLEVARVNLPSLISIKVPVNGVGFRRLRRRAPEPVPRQARRHRSPPAPRKTPRLLGYPGCDRQSTAGQGILRRSLPPLRSRSDGSPGQLTRPPRRNLNG